MAGHSLLRRIRQPELAAARRVISDDEARAAVLEHLRAMFLTRAGSAIGVPDYGVMSVTDIVHSCPDAIADVLRSIRRTIVAHEPRLSNPVVRHVTPAGVHDTTIRFEISGEIVNGSRKTPVKYQTVIDASRTVRIA
jgi:type VI secretion system lysozyme-like protein